MPDRLRLAVHDFVRTMHNPDDLDDLLDRLLAHADSALACAGAAILLEDHRGRLVVAAASSEPITRAERGRSESQTGVCHEAFTNGEVVVVCDLGSTGRWDDDNKRAVALGVRAAIDVPLTAWGRRIEHHERRCPARDGDQANELSASTAQHDQ